MSQFLKISFQSDCVYMGERIKKGTFKPSITPIGRKFKKGEAIFSVLPIPCSTATGAIRSTIGDNEDIHAIGKITRYRNEYISFAPFDSALTSAKLPITIEYLADVMGEIYIKKTDDFNIHDIMGNDFTLGGMKSKGFGKCIISSVKEFEPKIIAEESRFLSRVYYDDEILEKFGIYKQNILRPYFGYLFRKTSEFDGYYQKALFEESIVINGYDFLVEVIG